MTGSVSIWLYLILALNFGVSWWNARTCGRAWVESKAIGGSIRALVWCGAIQSAIGFSSVFLFPLLFLANALFPDAFTADQLDGAVSLWYVSIIFPALGTGLIITIESWIAAYRQHSLMNLGLAAYNTLAQVHNTMGAIKSVGPAFQAVGKLFASAAGGRGDAKGKAAILGAMIAIAVVVLALSAGVILTAVLIHRYARTVPLPAAAAATAPQAARGERATPRGGLKTMPRLRGAYLPHPAHLAFIRQHLEPSLEKVCVVDLPNEPQSEVTLAQARACIIGFLASPAGSPERKPR